jgi:beta-N-acetylhexosaminidase
MNSRNREITGKIGQMCMFGFSGTELNHSIREIIREQKIGGIILFSENILEPKQVQQLCHDLQRWNRECGSNYPLLISVDQEGGSISRIPWLMEQYPDPIVLGSEGSSARAFRFGYGLGKELSCLGLNVDLAPVLDILSNPDNTLLARRCLGSDAQKVAELGKELICGLHHGGILATGKHFPGHGDVALDSHWHLPVSHCTLETLNRREFIPFTQAIQSGLEIIMTAHIKYSQLDSDHPATLSKKIIQNILRNQLDFQGLIMTDDLLMKAIVNHYTLKDAALLAVRAGVDILLICHDPDQQKQAFQVLLENYQDDDIRAGIEQASQRIMHFKAKWQKLLAFI